MNEPRLRRRLLLPALGALALVCGAVILNNGTEVEYDHALHRLLLDRQVADLSELAEDYVARQAQFLPIAPPAPDSALVQPAGWLPILDVKGFPRSFVDGLVGTKEFGISRFPIWVREDGDSPGREIVVENALRQCIARIPREPGYRPDWFVRRQYPTFDRCPADEREWLLRLYDPARIVIRYDVLLDEDALIRVVWRETITAAVAAEEEGGGGIMCLGWGEGVFTNLQFVEIELATNVGMHMVLGYPEEYQTNENTAFEIFVCTDLIEAWWDPFLTTNVDTSTNWIEWTDTEATNWYTTPRFYTAAVEADQDGDGFTDGQELFVSHTAADDSNSYPVTVSGQIGYSGPQEGFIFMLAVLTSNGWSGCPVSMDAPGSYTNEKVAIGSNYWFKAYRDSNYNWRRDAWEAQGIYSNGSMQVTGNVAGIDITLSDPDDDSDSLPDWWELLHFEDLDETAGGDTDSDGLVNSNEYSEGTDPSDPDTDGDFLADGYDGHLAVSAYSQGTDANTNGYVDGEFDFGADPLDTDSDEDGFGDGFEVACSTDPTNSASFPAVLSGTLAYSGGQTGPILVVAVADKDSWATNHVALLAVPGAYGISNVPTLATYWLKAYRDANGNGALDAWEAWGVCPSNGVLIAADAAGLDIALTDPDGDADDLPDWWEWQYLGSLAYGADQDLDGDGLSNLEEQQQGGDPLDFDTDGDGVRDGLDAHVDSAADTDTDNLPDDWETRWFGNLDQTGAGDYDGDGQTNLEEYQAGTDPTRGDQEDVGNGTGLEVFVPIE